MRATARAEGTREEKVQVKVQRVKKNRNSLKARYPVERAESKLKFRDVCKSATSIGPTAWMADEGIREGI
jgi:hypothetical protein